mgnify:CR=1 FL=1|jgi:hypothetical protein
MNFKLGAGQVLLPVFFFLAPIGSAAQLLLNGDFEGSGNWQFYTYSQVAAIQQPEPDETRAAVLNWKREENSGCGVPGISQAFRIPESCRALKISYRFKTATAASGLQFRLRQAGSGVNLWYYNGTDWQQAASSIAVSGRTAWSQQDRGTYSQDNTVAFQGLQEAWQRVEAVIPVKEGISDYAVDFLGKGADSASLQYAYIDDVAVDFIPENTVTFGGLIKALKSGQALSDAQIRLVSKANSGIFFSAVSNVSGFFTLRDVPPGAYLLSVQKAGFLEYLQDMDVTDPQAALNLSMLKLSDPAVIWDGSGEIAAVESQGEVLLGQILPWEISFADGEKITCPKIDAFWERTVTQLEDGSMQQLWRSGTGEYFQLTQFGDGKSQAVWELQGLVFTLAVNVQNKRVSFEPKVSNKTKKPIQWVSVPAAAQLPLENLRTAILPWWGGQEFSKNFLLGRTSLGFSFPLASHDFFLFNYGDSWLGFYGADTGEPLRFATAAVSKLQEPAGYFLKHSYSAWILADSEESVPPTLLAWRGDPVALGDVYANDCGLAQLPTLEAKMGTSAFNQMRKNIHLLCMLPETNYAQDNNWEAFLLHPQLTSNLTVEFAGYNKRGMFDHYNPDTLPVNARLGGEEGFPRLVAKMKQRGLKVQMYIQANWWNPDAPSFQTFGGERIGLKTDWNNPTKATYEYYGANPGIRVQLWRPEVREKTFELTEQLFQYGVDYIFHDQLGFTISLAQAWDFDPQRPGKPYRYFQDLVDLAAQSWQLGPLASEGVGNDRLWPYLFSSHGHYFRSPLEDGGAAWWQTQQSRPWPYFALASSQTVAFYQHNLQSNTDTEEKISWQLALGINLSATHNDFLCAAIKDRAQWSHNLNLLAQIQESVAAEFVGKKLIDFEYVKGWLDVSKTTWEGGLTIWANHTASPQTISWKNRTWLLAPFGFLAVKGEDFLGGNLLSDGINNWSQPTYRLRDPASPQIIVTMSGLSKNI